MPGLGDPIPGPYNHPMHPRYPLLAAFFACTAFAAQPALVQPPAPLEGRNNQKIEHLHTEDAGNRIDELRYGGQTQSIQVQPKAPVPGYEIQPTDLARSRPADARDGMSSATGHRVWNLFKF